jgi:hypothetical protein
MHQPKESFNFFAATLQGPRVMYLDNVVCGQRLVRAALPHLGRGLAPLENGQPDSGIKQDGFHVLKRMSTLVPTDPSFKQPGSKLSFQFLNF